MTMVATTQFKFEGVNYRKTEQMSLTQIASIVRKEIRAFVKSSAFNFIKVSVRKDNRAIIVELDMNGRPHYSPEWLEATENGKLYRPKWSCEEYTKDFKEFIDAINTIGRQFNFDDSDSMTDYFHCRYYFFVKFKNSHAACN